MYADHRRHAKESEIKVGDIVMAKNYELGKLEPKFRLEKFKVIEKSGNDTKIENEEGIVFRRCVTHPKKWPSTTRDFELSSESPATKAPSNTSLQVPESSPNSSQRIIAAEGSPLSTSLSPRPQKRENPAITENPARRPKMEKKVPHRYIESL